jgi:hypothetical protein
MAEMLEHFFTKMGARVRFGLRPQRQLTNRQGGNDLSLDVLRDSHGEYLSIVRNPGSETELVVLDVDAKDRHLLLMSRSGAEKHRYLIGHDERHWFVAGIPESTPISRVRDAKRALKPDVVLARETQLRSKEVNRRVNAARIRQGEWFFVPAANAPVVPALIRRKEPLLRSRGGNPHVCDELYRSGGTTVYVSPGYPNGLTDIQYKALSQKERKRWSWRVMRRDSKVYVRGRVRHRDHKTVVLEGWHEVFGNTENLSYAMRNVVFLD